MAHSQQPFRKVIGFSLQSPALYTFLKTAISFEEEDFSFVQRLFGNKPSLKSIKTFRLQRMTSDAVACLQKNVLFDFKQACCQPFIPANYLNDAQILEASKDQAHLHKVFFIDEEHGSQGRYVWPDTFAVADARKAVQRKEKLKGAVSIFPWKENRFVSIELGGAIKIWDATDKAKLSVMSRITLPDQVAQHITDNDNALSALYLQGKGFERNDSFCTDRGNMCWIDCKMIPGKPNQFALVTAYPLDKEPFAKKNYICIIDAETGKTISFDKIKFTPQDLCFVNNKLLLTVNHVPYAAVLNEFDEKQMDVNKGKPLVVNSQFKLLNPLENGLYEWKTNETPELIVRLSYQQDELGKNPIYLGYSKPLHADNKNALNELMETGAQCLMQLDSGELMFLKKDKDVKHLLIYDPATQKVVSDIVLKNEVILFCPGLGLFNFNVIKSGLENEVYFFGDVTAFKSILQPTEEKYAAIHGHFSHVSGVTNLIAEYADFPKLRFYELDNNLLPTADDETSQPGTSQRTHRKS